MEALRKALLDHLDRLERAAQVYLEYGGTGEDKLSYREYVSRVKDIPEDTRRRAWRAVVSLLAFGKVMGHLEFYLGDDLLRYVPPGLGTVENVREALLSPDPGDPAVWWLDLFLGRDRGLARLYRAYGITDIDSVLTLPRVSPTVSVSPSARLVVLFSPLLTKYNAEMRGEAVITPADMLSALLRLGRSSGRPDVWFRVEEVGREIEWMWRDSGLLDIFRESWARLPETGFYWRHHSFAVSLAVLELVGAPVFYYSGRDRLINIPRSREWIDTVSFSVRVLTDYVKTLLGRTDLQGARPVDDIDEERLSLSI